MRHYTFLVPYIIYCTYPFLTLSCRFDWNLMKRKLFRNRRHWENISFCWSTGRPPISSWWSVFVTWLSSLCYVHPAYYSLEIMSDSFYIVLFAHAVKKLKRILSCNHVSHFHWSMSNKAMLFACMCSACVISLSEILWVSGEWMYMQFMIHYNDHSCSIIHILVVHTHTLYSRRSCCCSEFL